MSLGEQIKKVRLAKRLSQKEVVMDANIEKTQFSLIENNKTEPSFSTIEKIANVMGCAMSELFSIGEDLKDINSFSKSILEKVAILEHLDEDEKKEYIPSLMVLLLSKN